MPDKNPILLLHGALGSQSQLEPLKHLLEAKGRTVYTLNFSGHSGEPFRASFGIQAFAEDVKYFMRQNDLQQVDVFGYSMGGYVAIWFASLYPSNVGKIVTLGTKFDWSVASAEHEVRKLNPEKIIEKVPAFARILEHRHAPNDWKELIAKTSRMMTDLGRTPLLSQDIFKNIPHEVHILLGDHDDMADKDYSVDVAEMIPKAKFHLLKDTHHPIERVHLEMIAKLF
jgi:pimeloyl-ACP methyl ester carboxylesterase